MYVVNIQVLSEILVSKGDTHRFQILLYSVEYLFRVVVVLRECFVQIPAYRDLELLRTLQDLFEKAAYPGRLRVCVAWQHGKKERLANSITRRSNIEILTFPANISQGPNWMHGQ